MRGGGVLVDLECGPDCRRAIRIGQDFCSTHLLHATQYMSLLFSTTAAECTWPLQEQMMACADLLGSLQTVHLSCHVCGCRDSLHLQTVPTSGFQAAVELRQHSRQHVTHQMQQQQHNSSISTTALSGHHGEQVHHPARIKHIAGDVFSCVVVAGCPRAMRAGH